MRMQNILIGLAAMIIAIIVCVSISLDMYSTSNYNINLSQDESTKALTELQTQANSDYASVQNSVQSIQCNTPGQNCTDINPQLGLTEADLQKSALSALGDTSTFLDTFTNLITAMFNSIPLAPTTKKMFLWFIGFMIIIPIVFILINSFLKQPI